MKKVIALIFIFICFFNISVSAGDEIERMTQCDETQDALIVGKIVYMNNSILKINVIRVASGKSSTPQVTLLKWYHRDVIDQEAFHVGDGILVSAKYTNSAHSKCTLAYAVYKAKLMKDKKVKLNTDNNYDAECIESYVNTGDYDVGHHYYLDAKYKAPDIGADKEREHHLLIIYVTASSLIGLTIIVLCIIHKVRGRIKKSS